MARSEKILTPVFRVSFPNVFKPCAAAEGSEAKFNVVMLFPKDADLSELRKAASQAVREEWGDKPPANLRSPFRDQGEKRNQKTGELLASHEPGAIFITASSKRPPGVVDINVQPIITESVGESGFYPGCWARATVVAFTYSGQMMQPGVAFGLQNIQKMRDDAPLGGGASRPEDDFGPATAAAGTGAATGTDDNDLPW